VNFKSEFHDPEATRWALALWTSYRAMQERSKVLAAENPKGESFYEHETSIVGESFFNPDGSSRQEIIATLVDGESVFLLRESTNAFDPEAVAVCVMRGNDDLLQIGYLSRPDATVYATLIDAGMAAMGDVAFVGGGDEAFPLRGVRIKIYHFKGTAP
jgi:hypothetical protein